MCVPPPPPPPPPLPTPSQQSLSVSWVCLWTRHPGKANLSVQMLRFCGRSRCLTARTETGQRGCCATRPGEVRSAHTCPISELAASPALRQVRVKRSSEVAHPGPRLALEHRSDMLIHVYLGFGSPRQTKMEKCDLFSVPDPTQLFLRVLKGYFTFKRMFSQFIFFIEKLSTPHHPIHNRST